MGTHFIFIFRFDVWLGNVRGNKYSHKHMSLKSTETKFWDFSLDEVVYYDIPAIIEVHAQSLQSNLRECCIFSLFCLVRSNHPCLILDFLKGLRSALQLFLRINI